LSPLLTLPSLSCPLHPKPGALFLRYRSNQLLPITTNPRSLDKGSLVIITMVLEKSPDQIIHKEEAAENFRRKEIIMSLVKAGAVAAVVEVKVQINNKEPSTPKVVHKIHNLILVPITHKNLT
jgi:hypothetical protein